MNIYLLQEAVKIYKLEVVESGFQRDLQDFTQTIPQSASNIEILRSIGKKIEDKLNHFANDGISEEMERLFPNQFGTSIFTRADLERIAKLNADPQIQLNQYYQSISTIVTDMHNKCQSTSVVAKTIEDFVRPYIANKITKDANKGKGVVSIIFRDKESTKKLTQFTKEIDGWRKALPIYTTLITKQPPEDVEILDIQNGSIDLILNLDVNVAVDLAELFSIAIKGYGAFLAYKVANKKIDEAIRGNKRYEEIESEKQKLLLENIGSSVKQLLEQQVASDAKAKKELEALDKKIDLVATAVTNHVIKGNEIKLIAYDKESTIDEEKTENTISEIKQNQLEAKRDFRLIDSETRQKLLTQYREIDERI